MNGAERFWEPDWGEFSVTDLSAVAGQSAVALTAPVIEATAAGVLVESGERLAFRHALIRQALHAATPPGQHSAAG